MSEKLIVDNRRARHEYHLSDRVEAGVVLTGTEVKSLRGGEATLQQAYADVRDGEAWLVGLHVPEYTEGNRANHDPDRPRKPLLHPRQTQPPAPSAPPHPPTPPPTPPHPPHPPPHAPPPPPPPPPPPHPPP